MLGIVVQAIGILMQLRRQKSRRGHTFRPAFNKLLRRLSHSLNFRDYQLEVLILQPMKLVQARVICCKIDGSFTIQGSRLEVNKL